MLPSNAPLQLTFVSSVLEMVGTAGGAIAMLIVSVQEFVSVMVIKYVFADRFENVFEL